MAEEESTQGQRKQRSDVWSHFTSFRDGHGKKKARCKRCSQVLNASYGTSSLKKHANKCGCSAPEEEEAAAAIGVSSDHESGLQKEASKHLARMIALRGFSPSLLDDHCFRSFVASLSPEFRVPSQVDIENMCDDIFDEARQDVFARLRRAPGRVSVAVGTVTTAVIGDIQRAAFYTACHFIDDEWNLHKVIMDAFVDGNFLDLHGPFLGVEQVPLSADGYETETIERVMHALSERDVLDNLFFMVWETEGLTVNPFGLRSQIEQNKSNINPTRTDLILTPFLDNMIQCLAIWWYWRYQRYCSREARKEGSTRTNTGSAFAELICTLWGEMYRSIQRISALSAPTSNLCLIELFKLREVLQSELARASGDNATAYKGKDVADYLGRAIGNLDREIKESCLVWSIPLILDPRYKLTYIEFIFKRAFVDSEATLYISEVTKQIKKLYGDYIEYGTGISSANSDLVTVTAASSSADPLAEAWAEHCGMQDSRSRSTDVDSCLRAEKELDRYLQDFLVPPTESFDILKWWKENSWNYPTVAEMARDALAMPTCSKLSSDQLAHVKSILRGYSKAAYGNKP